MIALRRITKSGKFRSKGERWGDSEHEHGEIRMNSAAAAAAAARDKADCGTAGATS